MWNCEYSKYRIIMNNTHLTRNIFNETLLTSGTKCKYTKGFKVAILLILWCVFSLIVSVVDFLLYRPFQHQYIVPHIYKWDMQSQISAFADDTTFTYTADMIELLFVKMQ